MPAIASKTNLSSVTQKSRSWVSVVRRFASMLRLRLPDAEGFVRKRSERERKNISQIYAARGGAKRSFMDSDRTCDLEPTEFSVGHTPQRPTLRAECFASSELLAFDSQRAMKSIRVIGAAVRTQVLL